jgi:outer membrane immunogenic protein
MTETRIGLAFIVALLEATSADVARAANMPLKAPAPIVDNWTGYYAGINAGGAIAVDPTTDTGVLSSTAAIGVNTLFNESFWHAPVGAIVGGQLGYNWQIRPKWFAGWEADWQWTSQQGTANIAACSSPPTIGFFAGPPAFGAGSFGQCLSDQQQLTNLGTARMRIGYLVNESLWYVTGGAAWGGVKESFAYTSSASGIAPLLGLPPAGPFFPANASFSHFNVGWTVGAGVETKLVGPWSMKLEYLLVGLSGTTDAFAVGLNPAFTGAATAAASAFNVTSSSQFYDNIIRVGLNYKMR